jgi:L-aspartate oxidase
MEFECRNLILATGGAGQLFQFTTNSEVATGDGIALAFNAGAEIMDMEFFQFHPTAIRLPGITSFLISEAVRGEGGILRNIDGHRFMPDYTPEAELAPRDVVARSLVYEMQKTGSDTVFVDVTHLSPRIITSRFPHIYRFCLDHGLDITKDMLPVAPAAHYMMGGVKVNIWGETKIAGLFAAGEIACTGVHGANRLASNSMLEVVVFSKRIIERSKDRVENSITSTDKKVHHKLSERQPSGTIPSLTLPALQKLHWDKVGVIRNKEGLIKAADVLATWQKTAPRPTERRSYEFNNLILAGRLVTESALLREESRGAHFRSGFTDSNPQWRRHLVFTR